MPTLRMPMFGNKAVSQASRGSPGLGTRDLISRVPKKVHTKKKLAAQDKLPQAVGKVSEV